MAIVTKRVYINTSTILSAPSGHSIPTAKNAAIAAPTIEEEEDFELTAGTYTNANKVTAFEGMVAALETAIDALITSWGLATANTIDYNAEVFSIKRGAAADDIYLAEASDKFYVKVKLSIALS
ncbi:hypothetical protein [Marinoscillum furvescens]|uniref:Uncharacterized protein n=1 Tax=Marinoscillum furvescens DSM 4134 TaxID=1122208 RepID=A0A3D9L531_MARFU|nr:hypothetical protein [Marinoscillum furvescens]REE01133.1 hypothetical protein C7460_104153 [Marinoscillum furvescens DSM 4134]